MPVECQEVLPTQKGAIVTYQLVLRALADLDGLTTQEVADILGMSRQGALQLMGKLEQAGDPPVYLDDDNRWRIVPHNLKAAHRPSNAQTDRGL